MNWHITLWLAVIVVISNGFMAQAAESLKTGQVLVNGVDLHYVDQGTGTPVVFVHGSFSDLRFWEPQREAVARRYRFIALTQRYFGTTPWPDDGKHYADKTHAADLTAFLRQINAGARASRGDLLWWSCRYSDGFGTARPSPQPDGVGSWAGIAPNGHSGGKA